MGFWGAVFGGFPGGSFGRFLGPRTGTITPGRNDYKRFRNRFCADSGTILGAYGGVSAAATQPQPDQLDFFMAQGQGGMPGAPPRDAPSELDQLHAMGDAKFGRPRRR